MTKEERIIGKLLGKKNSQMVSDCVRIFELFDPPEPEGLPSYPLQSFLSEATNFDGFIKRIKEGKDGDFQETLEFRLENIVFDVAFGVGFVLGGMFDIPSPRVRKNIDAIKTAIKEGQILPYVPREKKRGGLHEKEKSKHEKSR